MYRVVVAWDGGKRYLNRKRTPLVPPRVSAPLAAQPRAAPPPRQPSCCYYVPFNRLVLLLFITTNVGPSSTQMGQHPLPRFCDEKEEKRNGAMRPLARGVLAHPECVVLVVNVEMITPSRWRCRGSPRHVPGRPRETVVYLPCPSHVTVCSYDSLFSALGSGAKAKMAHSSTKKTAYTGTRTTYTSDQSSATTRGQPPDHRLWVNFLLAI